MRKRTLLVGCGKVGRHLGMQLIDADERVVAIRRDPGKLPASFGTVAADLQRPLSRMLPAADAMVITLPPPDGEHGYRAALQNLAAALPRVPDRTVFVSSTRVLEGCGSERRLTEADAPGPLSERARTLLAGEQLAVDLFGAIILRPAGIYGPGRDRLMKTVISGRPVEHDRRTNRIHERDLVRTIQVLLATPDPPALLHAVDGCPALLGEVVTHIAWRLGVPVPPRVDPDPGGGTMLDGALLESVLGPLEFPDFRAGYDALIDTLPRP